VIPDIARESFVSVVSGFVKSRRSTHSLGILSTGGLGDFVLSLALCRGLLKRLPAASCQIIFPREYLHLAEKELPQDVLLPISYIGSPHPPFKQLVKGILDHAFRLRSIGFDKIICLKFYPNDWERWLMSFLGRHSIWGSNIDPVFDQRGFNSLCSLPLPFTDTVNVSRSSSCSDLPYIINVWRDLAQYALSVTLLPEECQPSLITPSATTRMKQIAFCPFGGSMLRDYPDDFWLAAFNQAQAFSDYAIKVLVSVRDHDRGQLLANKLQAHSGNPITLESKLSLQQFIQSLGESSLVVGVESAPIHIARALGRPFVALMGGGHFGLFGPYSTPPYQRWVFHELECYNCNWNCSQPTNICMSRIPPHRIAEAIDLALSAYKKEPSVS
jgi:ADP-heptose:LPS heptosyltransferase